MFKDYALLPYFIHEELFLLPEDKPGLKKEPVQAVESTKEPLEQATKAEKIQLTTALPTEKAKPAKEPETKAAPAEEVKPQANPNLIFGKNKKQLLILVEDHQNVVMERADGLLLKDILKALDFTFEDVAIVNICHCRQEVDWQTVKEIPFTTLFSFGITHPKLPFTQALAPYELEKSGDQKFLLADKLAVLRTNRSRKIALWNLLKQLFV